MIEFSYLLTQFFAEDGLTPAVFMSGGSDSVEIALRLARQNHKLCGAPRRVKYLSFKKDISAPIPVVPRSTEPQISTASMNP